jgi:Pentapeptide repeats (8 copies)
MTMPVQQKAINADTAMTRTDVVHLLQEGGNPEQLDVSHHDLRGINLMNGDLRGANLSQASVCEANLCGANLAKADLHGADLSGTYLCWADLHGANLREADLREADLSCADLRETDLRGANLDWAILDGAFLGRADLRGTSLDKTYVRGADLSWASFGEASDDEQLKHRLWRRGAIFREKPRVRVAGRFSERAGRHALGFALGFLLMSVVGLLCVLGIRVIRTHMRLKRHPGDRTPRQVGTSPECRS